MPYTTQKHIHIYDAEGKKQITVRPDPEGFNNMELVDNSGNYISIPYDLYASLLLAMGEVRDSLQSK